MTTTLNTDELKANLGSLKKLLNIEEEKEQTKMDILKNKKFSLWEKFKILVVNELPFVEYFKISLFSIEEDNVKAVYYTYPVFMIYIDGELKERIFVPLSSKRFTEKMNQYIGFGKMENLKDLLREEVYGSRINLKDEDILF